MAKQTVDQDLDLGIEKDKGPRKKLFLTVTIAALVLLLGGLGMAWMLFSDEGEREDEVVAAPAEPEKPPAIYQPLDPVFVVNLPPGGDAKMLQVGLEIMARDPDVIEFLKHNDPLVRNQLLDLFGTQSDTTLRKRTGKVRLQKEVLETLNRLIEDQAGPNAVEAVYFTAFVMQ